MGFSTGIWRAIEEERGLDRRLDSRSVTTLCAGAIVFWWRKLGYHQESGSMSLEEAILDKVRRLPAAKQEQVLRFADGLQQEPPFKRTPSRDRRREMDWIKQNRAKYVDRWVVVEGERLVAADTDGHRAFTAAKAAGIDVPFLVHVLPEDPLPFVPGW